MSNDERLSLGEKMERAVVVRIRHHLPSLIPSHIYVSVQPDSQKSTGTQTKETAEGKGDNLLKHLQPMVSFIVSTRSSWYLNLPWTLLLGRQDWSTGCCRRGDLQPQRREYLSSIFVRAH
jgi:hypothetical protein